MATNTQTSQEMEYKRYFCEKYFQKNSYQFDINYVDAVLKKNNKPIMYIEFKHVLNNENDVKSALAQIVLTNKIQKNILSNLAVAYKDGNNNDVLIYIDCSDNFVMYHNDVNWNKENRSKPSADAIYHIYNRIQSKLTIYKNDEIKLFIHNLMQKKNLSINITIKNFNVIFNNWKNEIKFEDAIENEQELISLFFVDILNNTKYENKVKADFFASPVSFEGTDLNNYEITMIKEKIAFFYQGKKTQIWRVKSNEKYYSFWLKYHRPPEESEFLKILERSATLYSDKYRRTTGAEYTPSCFVKLQNDILFNDKSKLNLNIDDFIIFDPCCGVANLENDFGRDFDKNNIYLSTLESGDVDICKIKGFENILQFDFLKDVKEFPKFYYQGQNLGVEEIAKKANKKLMIIMNPPYQYKKGFRNNLAIIFFNKCLKLKPDYIVFYYKFEAFFKTAIRSHFNTNGITHFKNSKYSIISHVFSNAKTTFLLNDWGISQVIFSKSKQNSSYNIDKYDDFVAARYELNSKKNQLEFIKIYKYYNSKNSLFSDIENKIWTNLFSSLNQVLGYYTSMSQVIVLFSSDMGVANRITVTNLEYVLVLRGINFNTHAKYFETNFICLRGNFENISEELKNDAIMFSLFYKNNMLSNKGVTPNYIMPFSAYDLKDCGCISNNLYVLNYTETDIEKNNSVQNKTFDFRQWLSQFNFSKEALDLKNAALKIFKFYHSSNDYENKNFNDSFYDITNAIMRKNPKNFQSLDTENDTRIHKTKTTKGTKGFGRNTIKSVIENEDDLKMFYDFFDKRDILAKKINKQLVEQGLLLWERENIY